MIESNDRYRSLSIFAVTTYYSLCFLFTKYFLSTSSVPGIRKLLLSIPPLLLLYEINVFHKENLYHHHRGKATSLSFIRGYQKNKHNWKDKSFVFPWDAIARSRFWAQDLTTFVKKWSLASAREMLKIDWHRTSPLSLIESERWGKIWPRNSASLLW